MSTTIPIGPVLFSDDFGTDTQVNPAEWNYGHYAAVDNPSYFGRTQIRQNLPSISDGAAHLTIDTYDPTGPGNAFVGTDIYTQQTFTPDSTGIVFEVVAKLDQAQGGLVGGIFPYQLLDPTTTDHNEIDTELVSNDLNNLSVNTYADQPLGAGSPQTEPLPAGDSLTQWHTYETVWLPNDFRWYVDGTQVAETTSNVPTGPMPLYLDFWVPDGGPNGWDYADDPALQPVNTAAANTTYGFDVASVLVAQLAPCFAAGTRIATARGEIAVEAIRVGELVRVLLGGGLLGGGLAPVIWVGRREVDCAHHPTPNKVWPVRVAAGAFGPGQPHSDLFLSPDHAVYVEQVLIPIKLLINGSSIVQVKVDHVTYHHLELAQHDVVLAHGLPAESFLDIKDGSTYANRPGPVRLYPDYSGWMWDAFGCARMIVTGPELAAARALVGRFAAVRAAA